MSRSWAGGSTRQRQTWALAITALIALSMPLTPTPPATAALSTFNSKIQIESHLPGEFYGPPGYGLVDVTRWFDRYTTSAFWYVPHCDGRYRCITLRVDHYSTYTVWGGAITRYWTSGNAEIWLSPALLTNPQWAQRHAMAHELWHATALSAFHSTWCNLMYYRLVNGCYQLTDYEKWQLRLH